MIKVLQCIDGLQRGGKERRLVELLKALQTVSDIEPSLALLSDRVDYREIQTVGMRIHRFTRRFRSDPSIALRFAALCTTIKPDVVHAWGSFASVCALPGARLVRARFVTSMITHAPRRAELSMQRRLRAAIVFPFADIILANSNAGLASYRAPAEKSLCIYNGFDFRRLERLEPVPSVRERLGVATQWLIGMVASFSRNKDYRTYLTAAQELLHQGIDVTFLAVGDGAMLQPMRELVAERWRNRILFLGAVAEVEPIINALDIGVLCTDERIHGEGISNTILEYMAAAKPVVASVGGGTGELVQAGTTGALIQPRDPAELARQLRLLLGNDELRSAMGDAGRQRVRERFNIDNMVHQHVVLYRRLTGTRPGQSA